MQKQTIKKIITIALIGISIAGNLVWAGNWFFKKEKQKWFNSGVVNTTNQFYEQGKTGELRLRNFILDKNGQLIIEDGRAKQGEPIILILQR